MGAAGATDATTAAPGRGEVVLRVEGLSTHFPARGGPVRAVDDVTFDLRRGETLCVVGESGSGKSVTARSILQIVDRPGAIAGGRILLTRVDGTRTDLAALNPRGREIRAVRGREIAMIFQEPMSSLSPVHRIGDQIGEVLRIHFAMPKAERRERVVELLRQVEIPRPKEAVDRYTFEFSGGMRQRVMIAMALACDPRILIADEPTTALDVTTQAEILDLIARLQVAHGMSVMFITHDMGVVAEIADRVLVMNRGRVMERGSVRQVFHERRHPYTRLLIGSVQQLETRAPALAARPAPKVDDPTLLDVRGLEVTFGALRAVDGVDLSIRPGETLGIVGESGSGKTTVGRAILRIVEPSGGAIAYRDAAGREIDVVHAGTRALRDVRRDVRMIFQDPVASLNARKTVAQIVGEPLLLAGMKAPRERDEKVAHLLEQVGLDPTWRERYPHAFSGGQRQRVSIARAIAVEPRLVIADEATSALDVSLRAQMLDLMIGLQETMGIAYLFISHDMSVIRYMCDRVGVMHRGRLVETGPTAQVIDAPAHDYTRALLSAIPHPDPDRRRLHDRVRYDASAHEARP